MTEAVRHRGPDAHGYFVDSDIVFGHRRLSILDPTDAGAQPMFSRDSSAILVYNGECYNFRELRTLLSADGETFRGGSDTEVILAAYSRWGTDGLKRLEGIFSIALWDRVQKRLILMRDRFGVKPLFIGESTLGLAFGSEIKAVLAAGGVDTALNDHAFSEFLWYGNSHEDRTFYAGITSLLPGQWLICENGVRRLEYWWRIEEWLDRHDPPLSRDAGASTLTEALDVAVGRQMVADVPIGIFLSGGVDSSTIAASARRAIPSGVKSFSAGFDFADGVNELPKAAYVARYLGLDHNELHIKADDLPDVLDTLARAHDEPFGDAANVPLFLMCRELSGRLKVVLQGDGGDELFGGYRRYSTLRNARYWRLWPKLLSPVARATGGWGRRFARMADSISCSDAGERMARLLTTESVDGDTPESYFTKDRRQHLLTTTDPFWVYKRAAERFRSHEPVQQMLLTDLTVQLPSQFLVKVDRASMAAGVEARVPMLDDALASLAVRLPSKWKVNGVSKKIVLRDSQRKRVPWSILNGPKVGFSVPYEYWLRRPLHEYTRERLLDASFVQTYSLDKAHLEYSLEEHRAGRGVAGLMLWKLLQLSLWRAGKS